MLIQNDNQEPIDPLTIGELRPLNDSATRFSGISARKNMRLTFRQCRDGFGIFPESPLPDIEHVSNRFTLSRVRRLVE